jgi:molybdopterin converting factor subunit 1
MSNGGDPIRVIVRFLASYREDAGRDSVEMMLVESATVGGLMELLRERFPGWGAMVEEPLVARNLEYARPDEVLEDGDEIAVFPPVSGG